MERNVFRLTQEELTRMDCDDALWGMYLYKMHTNLYTVPISFETASSLTRHDLSSILTFLSFSNADYPNDIIATKTFLHCSQALERLEETLSGSFEW